MDPDADADSSIFIIWPSRCQQKTNLWKKSFPVYYFLRYPTYSSFSKIKSQKDVKKQ